MALGTSLSLGVVSRVWGMRSTFLTYNQEMWWRKQPIPYLIQQLNAAKENAPKARFEADRLDDLAKFLAHEILIKENQQARARGRAENERYLRERDVSREEEQYLRETHAE
jgi:hypothetical protein